MKNLIGSVTAILLGITAILLGITAILLGITANPISTFIVIIITISSKSSTYHSVCQG